ncbi:MAG: hypothetical protein NVS9B9_19690 [Ktedonobacteraceae bacterium]
MASYVNSKSGLGAQLPDHAIDTSWSRVEPLLTPDKLRMGFLFGIPLQSQIKDPISGKRPVMTDELLKDIIIRAVSLVEAETHIDIMPVQRNEKYAYDRPSFESFGYFQLLHRPVSSIDSLNVTPSNNVDVYTVPLDWVETGNLQRGIINIIPLNIALTNTGIQAPQSSGGSAFLSILAHRPWIPAFWRIVYTSGYVDGMLPRIVNEIIGIVAAQEVLSMIAATHAESTSHSLGIDGVSQSISSPGPQLYKTRYEELGIKKAMLLGKLKAMYGLKMRSSNV